MRLTVPHEPGEVSSPAHTAHFPFITITMNHHECSYGFRSITGFGEAAPLICHNQLITSYYWVCYLYKYISTEGVFCLR